MKQKWVSQQTDGRILIEKMSAVYTLYGISVAVVRNLVWRTFAYDGDDVEAERGIETMACKVSTCRFDEMALFAHVNSTECRVVIGLPMP